VRITHLLDTSAVLAHYLDDAGADEVEELWGSPAIRVAISVLTLPELRPRLDALVTEPREANLAYRLYAEELTAAVPVTREVAVAAIELRRTATGRLPLVDAIIAACAKCESAVLVHRDPHMAAIPAESVEQVILPNRR
jgi:predicted nucleic acid-binding protein